MNKQKLNKINSILERMDKEAKKKFPKIKDWTKEITIWDDDTFKIIMFHNASVSFCFDAGKFSCYVDKVFLRGKKNEK